MCDLLKQTKSSCTEITASIWNDTAHNSRELLLNTEDCRLHEGFYPFCAPDHLSHKAARDCFHSTKKTLQTQSLPLRITGALVPQLELSGPASFLRQLSQFKIKPSIPGLALSSLISFTAGVTVKLTVNRHVAPRHFPV